MIKQWAVAALLSVIVVFGGFALMTCFPEFFIILVIVELIYVCTVTIKDDLFPRD